VNALFGVEVSRTGSVSQNNDRVRQSVQFVMFARRDGAIAQMERQIEKINGRRNRQKRHGQSLRIVAASR
jgi:hypothetical protein